MTDKTKQSFFQTLWDRKLPQYLGTYFAVGFGLLQFVEFITKRYDLSNVLIDKYLLVWLTLIPAIIILIYFGGQLKFKSTNLKWPKVAVIGNICIAMVLAALFFNDSVDEQSTIVEVVNEEGETVKAVVPNLNKVKTVAVFQFDNKTGNPENNWFGVAFSSLLSSNLNQRPEFYVTSAYTLYAYNDGLGLPAFVAPNLGMQREIARKSRNDYFINISYTKNNSNFDFRGHLYSSKDGREIIKLSALNTDLYEGLDQLKKQIFNNIPNPIKSKKNQINMPSSSLLTNNLEALEYHTKSRITFYKDPTALNETLALERKAVELDPSCSECHYYVGDVLFGLGRTEEAIIAIKQAIQSGKALPQRMQFRAKSTLYSITNNFDAYFKLQELRIKMFPYEFDSYQQLSGMYLANYGVDKAKELIQTAIDKGNVEKGLLALSKLQLDNEEYTEALKTLDRFREEFPDRDQDKRKYASIYEKQGELDAAKEVLIDEEALDPLNANIQVRLAMLEFKNLDISAAFKRIDQGLRQATTLTDSINFLWTKSALLEYSGQIESAFKTVAIYEKYQIKRTPVNRVITSTFPRKVFMYQSIAKPDAIEPLLANVVNYSPDSGNLYNCMISTNAIQWDFDIATTIDAYNLNCREVYEGYGEGYGAYFDVILAYQKQDYETCINLLESDNEKVLKLMGNNYFVSKVYSKHGDFEKAKALIKKETDQKTSQPHYYYQMALLLEEENPKSAKEYLEIALKFWTNADANYIPYQRAINLATRLSVYDDKIKM